MPCDIANDTEYGLTGSLYSNDPERIERAKEDYHVGNLYFNRKCTGAFVGVHPFGGFNMSGTDSKAGGRDYLLLFTQAKAISRRNKWRISPWRKVHTNQPGAWQISLPFLGEHEIIGSYLLAGENELAIIDPGPGSTLEPLLAAIREAGFEPQDVTHILATHVHLDHAGATGSLARLLPGRECMSIAKARRT